MRRLGEGLLLVAVSLLVATIAAEVAMRLAFHRSLDFGMEMWKYGAHLKHPVPNPRRVFAHRPGGHEHLMGVDVALSSRGLRDREFSVDKPAGVYRVLYLGDSTTFGWGAPLEGTIPKAVERELAARAGGRRYEVMNAGIGNYGTVQEVESYREEWRAFHPDLVVLQWFINDAEPVPRDASGLLGDHSYLRAFVASRYDGLLRLLGRRPGWRRYYNALYDEAQPGWQAARAAVHELALATRRDGAALAVVILPELHRVNGPTYPFERPHQLVRQAAAADGVPSLDLIEALRDRGPEEALWVTPLDAHPNARAAALVAPVVASLIADLAGRPAGAAVPPPRQPGRP